MSDFKVGDRVKVGNVGYGSVVGGDLADPEGRYAGTSEEIVEVHLDGKPESEGFFIGRLTLVQPAATKTRLYVAGPMRSVPFLNFPAFDKAAAELRAAGYEVWSPAEHDREVYGADFEKAYPTGNEDEGFDLRAALAADTAKICEWADGVALLDGWHISKGAQAEVQLAYALGIPYKDAREWIKEGAQTPLVDDWAAERQDVLDRFTAELSKATGDGSKKRQAGEKPPWWADDSHEAAIFSHFKKWKKGELVDPDSGAHPLAHAGWRCLAIACKESGNTPVPTMDAIMGDFK